MSTEIQQNNISDLKHSQNIRSKEVNVFRRSDVTKQVEGKCNVP